MVKKKISDIVAAGDTEGLKKMIEKGEFSTGSNARCLEKQLFLLRGAISSHNANIIKCLPPRENFSEKKSREYWRRLAKFCVGAYSGSDESKEVIKALLTLAVNTGKHNMFLLRLLQQVILKHNIDDVKFFLELGAGCNSESRDWVDLSTLRIELSDNLDNDKEIIEALLAASCDTGKQKVFLSQLLQQAVRGHKLHAVKYVLELDAGNSKDWIDLSSIRIIPSDTPDMTNAIVVTLLNTVQDTDKRNAFLLHLLRGAIADRCVWFVSSLLSLGADPNRSDKDCEAVSSACVDYYTYSKEGATILQVLLNAITNTDNKNELLLKLLEGAIMRHDARDAIYLLGLGADLSRANDDKIDMLSYWVSYYNYSDQDRAVIEALLEAKADPNRQNSRRNNTTVLHLAANKRAINLMKLLKTNNADINKEDNDGFNPIVYGFRSGKDFIKEMYEEGLIDFSYCNSKGENYLTLFFKQSPSFDEALSFIESALKESIDISEIENALAYLPRDKRGYLKRGFGGVRKLLEDYIHDEKNVKNNDDFSDIGFY